MITIYGAYRSRASRNIWLLGELGQGFAHKPVLQAYRVKDPKAADAPLNTLSPEFLCVSPAGAIPVMQDEGFALSESIAINFYIAKKFGGPLAPKDAREEAAMLQWAFYGVASVEAQALAIQQAHGGKPNSPEGRAAIAAAKEKLIRPLKVIDEHLRAHGHLVGGRFTLADINLAEMIRYAQPEAAFLAGFPALDAWLKACQARPAFQDMWAKRTAEPI
jgi:glutathione S-transferase